MQGYKTNYVNLITDNLRDRYENGFPILKELIQNADDAKAASLIFGSHPGFPHAPHPLLQGPGLWFLNDGEFKPSDVDALRSFGINSKAGDASAIGKFGLGMKSVFHLCEALFYVAWDGAALHQEGLTPWKQDGHSPHPEWDETDEADWAGLVELSRQHIVDHGRSWFLLWLPLRMKRHLKTPSGEESGAIISRFPGDDPSRELGFLDDAHLAQDVAEILPLLQHLERIEHQGEQNPFVVELRGESPLGESSARIEAGGEILVEDERPLLAFAGKTRESPDLDGWFAALKAREEWPRSWYRDELGREHQVADKTSPKGAVLFSSVPAGARASKLHWAVFLPVEDGGERLPLRQGEWTHSLTLHGQFFLDAGRRKIHGLEHLHEKPAPLTEGGVDDSVLRTSWNQRLAQDVVLPLVLPALARHVDQHKFSEAECEALTRALSESSWFTTFSVYLCKHNFWIRTLQRDSEPRWCLIEGDARKRLRPLPRPPKTVPERPWKAFPELASCEVLPYDVAAPCLKNAALQWQEHELEQLLSHFDEVFKDAPSLDYVADFLDTCAGPYLKVERIQQQLVRVLRNELQRCNASARRQVSAKARRLLSSVQPEKRQVLTADLPDSILNRLWGVDAPVLLLPTDIAPEPSSTATPDETVLSAWLSVLDESVGATSSGAVQRALIRVIQGLLQTLPADARGRFLRTHSTLRIIAVQDARSGKDKPVSFKYLEEVRSSGTLFGFAEGLGEARLGFAPHLSRALPDAEVCLVRAQTYRELFPDQPREAGRLIPSASDAEACLAAVGAYSGNRLGTVAARRALLEQANNPGANPRAVRGLRLLLHGSLQHRLDDDTDLWIGGYNQHSAWHRLWLALHEDAQWSLVPEELADAIPRARSHQAKLCEIDAEALISELGRTGKGISEPETFSVDEREEILSCIPDEELWRRLPLHTTVDGTVVSAAHDLVYLAPERALSEDPLSKEATLIAPSGNAAAARRQEQWLRPLDERARIEIALKTDEPWRHWASVMDALARLPAWDDELRELLQGSVWLPTAHGAPVNPEDVVDLEGPLGDEAHRLVTEHRSAHGACFAVPDEVDPAVRAHSAWDQLRQNGFSCHTAALERLGLLLEDLPRYHVGEPPPEPTLEGVQLLARCPQLPGWRLLEFASAEQFDLATAWEKLKPGLSCELDPDRVVAVLDWLSEAHDPWPVRKALHDAYLRLLLKDASAARASLRRLRLASSAQRWREASELCAGVHGVARDRLLDDKQLAILSGLVYQPGTHAAQATGVAKAPSASFQLNRTATHKILADYFGSWDLGLVPGPMIGTVLGLMGPTARNLAARYLHPHSFDWLVEKLPWRDPGGTAERREWMGGKSLHQALTSIEAAVEIKTGNKIEACNLLGRPINVELESRLRTLLAGALSWQGGYGVVIPLRQIEPSCYSQEQLHELLRATAERLYDDLYNQPQADLGALWRELNRSDQLEIHVARRLILDHIPFYLRQLSVKSARIEELLAECDAKRRRVAEAEASALAGEPARGALSTALEALARHIDQGPEEQQAVVRAVKNKLEQYQYDLSSIPLELFQNADDAAVELAQLHAYPEEHGEVPTGAQRFVVEERAEGLRFLHWGRPINARGPIGFDGERRGYDRDLEKMLILSASDKRAEGEVTGKFGLGFKSVLLACDQPRILSGRLALRLVAGILPQPWKESQAARQQLVALGADSRLAGTLIELPGIQDELRDQVLSRFRELAGILCVFGRAIRCITHIDASQSDARWRPREVCEHVEVGQLALAGEWGRETTALCVRTSIGSVLIALSPRGFRALPSFVPAIWVTAPTRESSTVGFAINGDFQLDAGRGRLAGSTEANVQKAKAIGAEVGAALAKLLEQSRKGWESTRSKLGLAEDVDPQAFWESVWLGLTKGWHGRSEGADIARGVAVAALARLAQQPGALPNGLQGPLRAFSDAGTVRYELSEALLQDGVTEKLHAWPRFLERFPAESCVSKEIGAVLREAKVASPQPLGLPALVGLLDRARALPADAELLGQLRLLTEQAPEWESTDLQERLAKLLFRSEAGTWVEPRQLLAAHGPAIDVDEPRRHALAPPESRLHPDYYADTAGEMPAIEFFLTCRPRMEASTEALVRWVLDASSAEAKVTALRYLADGELGERVAERVRDHGWLRTALYDDELTGELTGEQAGKLGRRLVSAQGLEFAIQVQRETEDEAITPSVDLATALDRLHQWWSRERTQRLPAYRNRLFPQRLELQENPDTGRIDRSSWLMLLALGSFQAMGRTREEQHCGFIQHCQERGWWDVFTTSDPKQAPDKWMEVIEKYAEAQHDDEVWTLWIAQFPKLYRLRRWLGDYADLFLSIDRFEEPLDLGLILAPRSNPHFQGGGIDAPPLTRTLKVGVHLVVRELLCDGIITNPLAIPYAYAPIERMRDFFGAFGEEINTAEDIHQLLTEHLGAERATFCGDYDIPLRIAAADEALRHWLLRAAAGSSVPEAV